MALTAATEATLKSVCRIIGIIFPVVISKLQTIGDEICTILKALNCLGEDILILLLQPTLVRFLKIFLFYNQLFCRKNSFMDCKQFFFMGEYLSMFTNP